MTTPIAVLLSGRGSNFLALHRAIESGDLPARIVLVLSNRENAPGIAAAEDLGLPTAVLPHKLEPDRASHEAMVYSSRWPSPQVVEPPNMATTGMAERSPSGS